MALKLGFFRSYTNDTHTSHLDPDSVVVGEGALQVGRQLAGVDVLRQALQARQVRLKRVGISFLLLYLVRAV